MTEKEPIDQKVISDLQNLMGEDYLTVYEAFLRSGERNMADLSTAVENNEIAVIQTITHTLKGSSANIGARRLSEISKQMLDDARNGLAADYHSHLNHLKREYGMVRELILSYLAR